MSHACAYVYVHPHGHHKTRLSIDYRHCGKLDPHETYSHGKGVRITYGSQGEWIIIMGSTKPRLSMVLPGEPLPQTEVRVVNLGFTYNGQ